MPAPVEAKKGRRWHDRWLTKSTSNGEMIKAWCSKPSKESGMVRCKYCKKNIKFNSEGGCALVNHAESRKHMDNSKLFHLRALKAIHRNVTIRLCKSYFTVLDLSHIYTDLPILKSNSRIRGSLTMPAPVEVKKGRRWHDRWLTKSTSNGEMIKAWCFKPSKESGMVRCKYCKKNIKFDSKGGRALVNHAESRKHMDNSKLFHLRALKAIHRNAPNKKPSHPKISVNKSSSTVHGRTKINRLKVKLPGSATSLSKTHFVPSVSKKSPISTLPSKFSVPILSKNFLQFKKQLAKAPLAKNLPCPSSRKRPTPPTGISKLLHKLSSSTAKLSGSLQRQPPKSLQSQAGATPRRPPTPALSLLLGHIPRSQSDLDQVYLGSNLRAAGPPPGHGPLCKLIPVFMCYFCQEEFPSKSSLYQHQAQCTMKLSAESLAFPVVLLTPLEHEDFSKPKDSCDKPTTPVKLSINVPNNLSPQKQNKSGFLNQLGLLPKKTALQEQKRISGKRRNTECESLDWEEEDFTLKTPCTPPTPKLLISHLSREEDRRGDGLHHHRIFRLSSSDTWKKDVDKDEKDLLDELMKSDDKREGEIGSENAKDGKYEGKISVARSLYNVDVTSPLGQFVVKHYRADPSLHILSDIESHCLTASPTSNRTLNFCLRVRHDSYPITFMTNGRRALFQDYFHEYKFNKKQVRNFMKRANTGLDKNSRQLLRKMKKCQVLLKHITKSDLRHWISSQNDITVDLKPLSVSEIAYWTMPKPTPSEESVSIFPNGLKFTSPNVRNVLGLKSKKEVRIKTVDVLNPSVLTITNYLSEETCADLLMNQKTLYRCLLSDNCKGDSENMDISDKSCNVILRHMLSSRQVFGDCWSSNTLPDITNFAMTRNSDSSDVSKCNQINHLSKNTIGKESKPKNANKISVTDVSNSTDVISKSNLDEKHPIVYDVSCASFINPKPSDLPRGEIPSHTPETSPEQFSGRCRMRSSKLHHQKFLGSHSIEVRAPVLGVQDILSVEDDPQLLKPFLQHFEYLRKQPSLCFNRVSDQTSSLHGVDSNRERVTNVQKQKFACQNDNRLNKSVVDYENHVNCCVDVDNGVSNDNNGDCKSEHKSREKRQNMNHRSRRKSSPRVTKRVKLGLNRRLSAAGLVKRDELLGSTVSLGRSNENENSNTSYQCSPKNVISLTRRRLHVE